MSAQTDRVSGKDLDENIIQHNMQFAQNLLVFNKYTVISVKIPINKYYIIFIIIA